ncbi:sulfatase-like hydrolase/transferase [Haladaptatus pallidirubidus]|uniref:Sulfatase N-terminal domain-containing protein n=1 Tax=Haladaptatus pallidirubidus TaxID=1008152 RepID=A0AAV3UGG8_9EURY|nr:sulfatase-like hydrolase/transferase [Haladaptatus pallidirubidus]
MPPAEKDTETSPRNVVVVCLDTVRADFFAEYAKRLQRLADVSFTRCRAVSSWTVPSHASMFTGELPSEHGVHTHNRRFDSIEREETFLAELDGYATFGVSANSWINPTYGFDSWFDEFDVVEPRHRYPEATSLNEVSRGREGTEKYVEFLRSALRDDHPLLSLKNTAYGYANDLTNTGPVPKLVDDGSAGVVRAAKRQVKEAESPYFGFCNLMEAHTPLQRCLQYDGNLEDVPLSWTSNEFNFWELLENERGDYDGYWRNREQVYGATIDYLDRILAEFIHYVLDAADRETTIVITADHGENHANEADEFLANHKSSLSEGLIHVPLLLINPPEGYDKEEDEYVSHLDFGDLVVGLANGETPDVIRDRLPAELVGMSAGPEPPSEWEYWDRMIRCVYEGTTKTVWDSLGTRTEYEIDPSRLSWQKKVETDEGTPEVETDFFDTPIEEAKATAAANGSDEIQIDSATESRLEELGYL